MNKPSWLKVGARVDVGIFCGVITDIATSPTTGAVMVYVESLKERRLGRVGEWLQYNEEHMTEATPERISEDTLRQFGALRLNEKAMWEFDKLARRIQRGDSAQ